MNIAELPFDADEMLAGLRPWVECESPTFDRYAVNRMMDLASRDLAMMGAAVERIPGRMGLGDVVRARFPHPKARPWPHSPPPQVSCHSDETLTTRLD